MKGSKQSKDEVAGRAISCRALQAMTKTLAFTVKKGNNLSFE